MMQMLAIALNTFREAIRNRLFAAMLLMTVGMLIVVAAFSSASLHEEVRLMKDMGLFLTSTLSVVIAIFVGVNLVYKEIERKTIYTVAPKPIHRSQFLMGKFLGLAFTLAVQVIFLGAALAETGLASCTMDIEAPGAALLEREVLGLRDLYKFEFFYKPTAEFLAEVQEVAEQRYPNWSSGERSLQTLLREQPPRFGHAILRSITESYLVIAATLLELEAAPVHDRKKFTARLMAQGEQMLLRRTITCESSVSQDMFATGLRLAEHLNLLHAGGDLRPAREAFAERVVKALSAINLLQRSYDAAWFAQLSSGKIANLLGP